MSIIPIRKPASARDLAVAREVLAGEAQSLATLATKLGDEFSRAVELILACTGRVVVSGIGKSGHIGAKISATFASTGTPSFFLHAAEAAHGDLGMLGEKDILLAISHSGESRELSEVLSYAARHGIAVLALTGKAESSLAKAASVILNTHVEREVCPMNMAPTTSTTVALAYGDALAVALMERRGFRKEDFARYHPGGKLGKQLLKVADIMASADKLPLAPHTSTMDAVILEMTTKNQGGVGLVDETGVLVGLISDGDLKRHMAPDLLTKKASTLMTHSPKTITTTALATEAVHLMQTGRFTLLFVVDDAGKPCGILNIHHCLQAGIL